jgi:hypothetical protein
LTIFALPECSCFSLFNNYFVWLLPFKAAFIIECASLETGLNQPCFFKNIDKASILSTKKSQLSNLIVCPEFWEFFWVLLLVRSSPAPFLWPVFFNCGTLFFKHHLSPCPIPTPNLHLIFRGATIMWLPFTSLNCLTFILCSPLFRFHRIA